MAGSPRTKKPASAAPALTPPAGEPRGLVATVQPLTFEPGLYRVEISAPAGQVTELGVVLPCVRIEFLPATPACPGHGTLVTLKDGGWLWASDVPTFVTVAGGCAGALMTSYRAGDDMRSPAVRITHLPSSLATAAAPDAEPVPILPAAINLWMVAHVTGAGELAAAADGWLGEPGGAIEGFSMTPGAPFAPADIEYQAILGTDWCTPWVQGGMFCGSRGLNLPIFGFRLRLGKRWPEYGCTYSGRFAGGLTSGPHHDGETCQADETPLEALHAVIARRTLL
jgi:hypothetical protein